MPGPRPSKRGEHTMGFRCRRCHARLIMTVLPKGVVPPKVSGSGRFRVPCTHCDIVEEFGTGDIETFDDTPPPPTGRKKTGLRLVVPLRPRPKQG